MAGRPGLYDELAKVRLLDQGRAITLGDGSDTEKASRIEAVLRECGSKFSVTPRSVFILRHRFQENPDTSAHLRRTGAEAGKSKNNGKSQKKGMHPHDGRRQNKGTPPPGPHSSAFKPGNDAATITGVRRNPVLRGVSPEKQEAVAVDDDLPADLMRQQIQTYRLLLMDLVTELEAVKASTETWVWVGSTYTRQEGDGELMGTGRIAQRKRMSRIDAIFRLSKDVAYVQAKLDAAVSKLHVIEKGADPEDPQAGLKALAAAIESSKQRAANQKTGGAT